MIAGETSNHNFNTFTNTEANDHNISTAPANDNGIGDNFLDDGDIDDFSSTPNFEVYEKVEINHGLLVSTRQAPKTFYHKVVPSKTVQVHINPTMMHQFPLTKSGSITTPKNGSLSEKFASVSRNMLRTMTLKITKSQNQENGSPKVVEGGSSCGEVNNMKSYLTFALALCAIWVQIVTPFS